MLGMDTTTATIEDFPLFMIFGFLVASGYMKFQMNNQLISSFGVHKLTERCSPIVPYNRQDIRNQRLLVISSLLPPDVLGESVNQS